MIKKTKLFMFLILLLLVRSLPAGTIHGFVREKGTKEPVIMGNVWIKGTTIGTTTNMKGYYVFSALEPGTYEVYYRYIGYKTVTFKTTLGQDETTRHNVLLEPEPIMMEAAIVTAERDKRELEIKPSQITVQVPQLRNIPSIAEADLFRAIQMLPGVATLSDFSAGLYIRGGSADQNLILLDNIDVYNPNHMFGFFSTFNTDAIKSVEILKGGFPAKYGGRLSSVLNVLNKEGNRESFHGVTRLSLLSASATLEGPWKKGSWMVSGRRTYLDLATKLVDFNLPYYFYDGHAKINYDIDENNQASISFYAGNDVLDFSNDGTSIKLDWGNKTFSSQWTHLFSSVLFSHFVFAGSRFDSDTKITMDDVSFGIFNEITDLALKGALTYSPSTRHSMDFGFEGKMLDFDLNYEIVGTKYFNSFEGKYASVYFQDNYKLNSFNVLQTGLRYNYYSDGNYSRLVPRISLNHIFTDRINMTVTYGRFTQFLNMVQQDGMSFADMWFPVDATFEPGQAEHYILGFNYDNQTTFSVNIEGYYKNYLNIAEFRSARGADEDLENQTAAQNFYSGDGYAYGGEIYLRNKIWGLEGWIGYSLSWTKKQVNGFNFDKAYFPTYDRRHTITAIQDYRLAKNWRLNMAFKFGSGQPYTEATARFATMGPDGQIHHRVLEGEKNIYRLPAYQRLDIGVFWSKRPFGLDTEFYMQAVNVYNHKNVWFREYDTYENPAVVDDITMIPFLPTGGFSIKF